MSCSDTFDGSCGRAGLTFEIRRGIPAAIMPAPRHQKGASDTGNMLPKPGEGDGNAISTPGNGSGGRGQCQLTIGRLPVRMKSGRLSTHPDLPRDPSAIGSGKPDMTKPKPSPLCVAGPFVLSGGGAKALGSGMLRRCRCGMLGAGPPQVPSRR